MTEQQEPNKGKKFKGLFNNRNILVFLAFVVLSSFLWFLNYLSKNLTSDLTLKYKFKNMPKSISVSDNYANNGEIYITATGQGYHLLQESLKSRNLPLIIDFESTDNKSSVLRYSRDNSRAYIVTNDLKPIIRKKLVDKITFNDIKPDTIFFEVNGKEKKVPIDATNVKLDLIPGQKITNIRIEPDSISIIGLQTKIDSIDRIFVSSKAIEHIKSNKKYTLNLEFPDGVNATQNTADVEYEIEMFTETNKTIKIKPLHFPSNFDYSLLPKEVKVYYSVALPYYDKISEYDFSATVDYRKAVHNCLEITVLSTNPYVNILKCTPETCTFILDKK